MDEILNNTTKFEKVLGYEFVDKHLLVAAFTHRSYLNENKGYPLPHNERLEFLGDAVLELVTTEYLYHAYPDKTEGELTSIRAALVNTVSLSARAEELGLDDHLLMSKGEQKDKGRARGVIWANAFEALIGALYIDGGYKAAKKFIERVLMVETNAIVEQSLWQDPKSVLQEKAQEHEGKTPIYKVIKSAGPDHAKRFTVGAYIGTRLAGKGIGMSKQEAETAAAKEAIETSNWSQV